MDINEFEKQLRLILKNRLSNRVNPRYLEWLDHYKKTLLLTDKDHICKRRNDLLIALRTNESHISREYEDYTENFIQALDNLFEYVEFLQEELYR